MWMISPICNASDWVQSLFREVCRPGCCCRDRHGASFIQFSRNRTQLYRGSPPPQQILHLSAAKALPHLCFPWSSPPPDPTPSFCTAAQCKGVHRDAREDGRPLTSNVKRGEGCSGHLLINYEDTTILCQVIKRRVAHHWYPQETLLETAWTEHHGRTMSGLRSFQSFLWMTPCVTFSDLHHLLQACEWTPYWFAPVIIKCKKGN